MDVTWTVFETVDGGMAYILPAAIVGIQSHAGGTSSIHTVGGSIFHVKRAAEDFLQVGDEEANEFTDLRKN